jgi:hypothetical protein
MEGCYQGVSLPVKPLRSLGDSCLDWDKRRARSTFPRSLLSGGRYLSALAGMQTPCPRMACHIRFISPLPTTPGLLKTYVISFPCDVKTNSAEVTPPPSCPRPLDPTSYLHAASSQGCLPVCDGSLMTYVTRHPPLPSNVKIPSDVWYYPAVSHSSI